MTLLRMAFDREISKDMGDAVTVARKLSRIVSWFSPFMTNKYLPITTSFLIQRPMPIVVITYVDKTF